MRLKRRNERRRKRLRRRLRNSLGSDRWSRWSRWSGWCGRRSLRDLRLQRGDARPLPLGDDLRVERRLQVCNSYVPRVIPTSVGVNWGILLSAASPATIRRSLTVATSTR